MGLHCGSKAVLSRPLCNFQRGNEEKSFDRTNSIEYRYNLVLFPPAMDLELDDKIALITGSSQGIGFAIAEALSKEGARVILNSYKKSLVDEAVDRLLGRVPGARVGGIAGDLTSEQGIADITQQLPAVDILVNNVGFYAAKDFEKITDEDWIAMMNLNFMSGVRLSRAYLPEMKERGWGRIVFISSESGIRIPPEMVHYGVSKAAQIALARGIAEGAKGTGVTVNSVLPGPVRSEGVEAFIQQTVSSKELAADEVEKDFFASMRPTSIIKRFIRPEEVAAFVTYLCSARSAATNGAALRVDGGVVPSILDPG
jgi:NAD(P)-dependent dehydrogenase (short-subunit alcohol dehydrogenase family)